jgi:hypothetical protein
MTPTPPVIAQQYSSAAFVSYLFPCRKEKFDARFNNASI